MICKERNFKLFLDLGRSYATILSYPCSTHFCVLRRTQRRILEMHEKDGSDGKFIRIIAMARRIQK